MICIGLSAIVAIITIHTVYGAEESQCIEVKTESLIIISWDPNSGNYCNDWITKFSDLGYKITQYEMSASRVTTVVMQR